MDVEIRRNIAFKFNNHIRMFWLLATVFKVSETFAQADYCSGGISAMNNCLNEIGILSKNNTRMPVNLEELNVLCADFAKGMKCLHDFAVACLEETRRESIQSHLRPAMYTMNQLCENNKLRQEFLKYPECNKVMSDEWERCNKPFINVVNGQNSNTKDYSKDNIINICCAKFCFMDCINRVTRLECVPEAAAMHRELAAVLNGSPVNPYNCTSLVNSTICKDTCGRSTRNASSFVQIIVFFLVYVELYSWRK